MSESNELSYNQISESWIADREKSAPPPEVVKLAGLLQSGDDVLDVGCGSGVPIAKYLSAQGLNVSGFDISENLVAHAQVAVPEGKFAKADVNSFKANRQFDGVVAWDSLFHLRLEEQDAALNKVMSWVKPDGYLLFTHGGEPGELTGEMHGAEFAYSSPGPEVLQRMLDQAGFHIIDWDVQDTDAHKYMVGLAQKQKEAS